MTKHFFCSWSGGKDSALALHKAVTTKGKAGLLLTMMIESGDRSRSHGIPKNVLIEQAHCMEIPIRFCATSWNDYTDCFIKELHSLYQNNHHTGIFGDIDIESHRQWIHSTCQQAGLLPHLPLWQMNRETLLNELFELGFRAEIISIKDTALPCSYLGKALSPSIIEDFRSYGIDLCGEAGEYHTLVTDGPLFKKPLSIQHGKQVLRDGYWFSDVSLQN